MIWGLTTIAIPVRNDLIISESPYVVLLRSQANLPNFGRDMVLDVSQMMICGFASLERSQVPEFHLSHYQPEATNCAPFLGNELNS